MLAYAYMGDALYDAFVRDRLIRRHPGGDGPPAHLRAVRVVRCGAQAKTALGILDSLTAGADIFRRGRNAKSPTVPKMLTWANTGWPPALRPSWATCICTGNGERLQEILALCEAQGWEDE